MDSADWLSWIFLVILLLLAAYFAAAEISAATVSRIRLRTRVELGDAKASRALYVQEHFDEAESAILIGTNIVHISLATLTTLIVTRTWGSGWVALGTIICTITLFFAGEMLPKSIGKRYSEGLAVALAPSLCFLMRLFSVFTRALAAIGAAFTKLFGGQPEVTVTEEELHDIIETMTDEGDLPEERGELVSSALEFNELTAEDILTPRVDLSALAADASSEQILAVLRTDRFSRIPVYSGSIDNIIGILQARKYMRAYLRTGSAPLLTDLLDPPCFVHCSAPVNSLLEELNRRKAGVAVITDNYGGTMGIVTVEDILEELVGEIWDEDDEALSDLSSLGPGRWEASADLTVEDLLAELDYSDPDGTDWEHKSLGEWAYEQFGHIPEEGESFCWQNLELNVSLMDHNRIRKLTVTLKEAGGDEQ